jgi:hypothetical protein
VGAFSVSEHIKKNGLCKGIDDKSGIYAIIIDNKVVYVGQAQNILKRVKRHYWHMINIPVRHKYYLLKQAIANNIVVDCVTLKNCLASELNKKEKEYILACKFLDESDAKSNYRNCPPLNNLLFENPESYPYDKFIGNLSKYKLYTELD